MKCELCNTDVSVEECVLAVHKIVLDGKEHHFCCELHAREFERKQKNR